MQSVASRAERVAVDTSGGRQVWHVWNREATGHPPLVLLHGGSGSWTHWIRNVDALSADRAVWAIDLPGFGDSDLPPEVRDVDLMFPYVEEGLQRLFGHTRVDLMGFSFGGMTSGFIAAHYPERIHRLLLIGIPALGLFAGAQSLRGLREDMTAHERAEVMRHNLLKMMLHHPDSVADDTVVMQDANVSRDRMRRRRIARSDVLLQLQQRWTCPVYTFWGEHDVLYTGRLNTVREALQGCRLMSFHIIPDAGHWVMYERAQIFNELVLQTLQSPLPANAVSC
jgi:2-hydroxy-6-oxonona-2,4-dienedioate hydrolase